MSRTWRKWFVAALAVAFAVTLISGPAVAKKPVKPPSGGGSVPPGTIYFQDNARGFSGPQGVTQIVGMKANGSGKSPALPAGITGQPSNLTYGDDGDRWWLTQAEVPDSPDDIETAFHAELFAIRPDQNQPDGLQWVQITDLFDPAYVDAEDQYPVSIEPGWSRWSNDGLDSDVSFKGRDYRDNTNNIYRLPVKDDDGTLFPGDSLPYGLEDLEVVLKSSREEDEQGRIMDLGGFTWSPDGTQLAFFVGFTLRDLTRDPRPELPTILYVKTAGDPFGLGAPIWTGDWPGGGRLDWSPDGSRIVFVGRTPPDYDGGLWTITPDGVEAKRVLAIKARDDYRYPCWSPDSRYVAMTVIRGHWYPWDKYIAVFPVQGGGVTLLTSDLDPATGKAPVAWVP